MLKIKIIYEDADVLVVDKPSGIIVFQETITKKQDTKITALIDLFIEKNPKLGEVGSSPRYGVVHRLDKDTSGILLVAKNEKALIFFQKQFKNRKVEKRYIALATGIIRENERRIETLIGRSPADPRKQKVYSNVLKNIRINNKSKREAITEYKVLERFEKYTLLEVKIKTGRKHQIRCHLSHIHHPIAGDKLYGFKDSPILEGLNRQFLHAAYLKIKLPSGEDRELKSELPDGLQVILNNFKTTD